MIFELNEKNISDVISSGTVVLDFFAHWCGPCKMLMPELEKLISDNNTISICKIDVDKYPEIAREYGVMTIPTLVLYKEGSLINKHIGYMPCTELDEWIKGA